MNTLLKERMTENALEIAGLTFRGFGGEEDLPGMLAVYKAAMTADGLEASDTLEEIANNYRHLERCDPFTDMIMAEFNGEMIAYGRCWYDVDLEDNYLYGFFINLRPAWRNKGVGKSMAAWLINRISQIALDHPENAAKFIQIWISDVQKWQTGLIESLGFQPVRYSYEMVRPCAEPITALPLPEGIEVRPITPDLMRQVWEAETEAFRDHWGYIEPTEESYTRWLERPHRKPAYWKVAFEGDEVVGMVRNFIDQNENDDQNRKRGYTENISVRRPWRRQGIARALLTQSIQMFQEMGMEETSLGVDTENPNGALELYTDVGYRKLRTWITYRKPLTKSGENHGSGS